MTINNMYKLKIPKINFKKWKNKLNTTAKVVVLLSPFLILGFIGFKLYSAYNYKAEYSVDFDKNNFKNKELPLYIDELADSPKFSYFEKLDGQTFAQIEGSPLSFVFKPKKFPLNKILTFSAKLRDIGNWEISLVCDNCEKKDQYNWQSFSYGWLHDNYQKVITYPETSIYSSDVNHVWENADNLNDWLTKNIKKNDNVTILDKVIPQSRLANQNINFKDGSITILDKSIRGPHQFYVYLKDILDLNIIKKDLNNYDNSDDVRIALYNLDDNLIKEDFIPDDGIAKKNNDFAPVVRKNIKIPIPYSGIYKLSIEETGTNITKDWLITYLKINTNKIMFVKEQPILFVQPIELYANVKNPTSLETNIWYKEQIQATKISSIKYNFQINNTENNFNKWEKTTLEPENYLISYSGNQYLKGPNMSWKKEYLFDIFSSNVNEIERPNIVISKYKFIKTLDNFVEVKKQFSSEEISKLNDLKNITFQIRNIKLQEQFEKEDALFQKGYKYLAQFNQYNLFGTKELSNEGGGNNLSSWLNNVLPVNSSIQFTDRLNISDKDLNINSSDKRSIIKNTIPIADFLLTENINSGQVLFKTVKINVE